MTNHAKDHKVKYMLEDKVFDVHKSYKDQLTAFSKKRFDPFKRRKQKSPTVPWIFMKKKIG